MRRKLGKPISAARSARSRTVSLMIAPLSCAPALAPRATKARNAFSRRSRRAENCRNGSSEERESVTACLPGCPRSAAVRAAAARKLSGRPTRSSGAVENHREGFFVGEHVLPELGAQRRQPFADRGEPRLLVGREPGAGAHESRAIAIERARGFRVERQRRLRPVQRFDALEQRVVEKDRAALARQDRRDLALDLLQRVVAVGAGEIEEHRGDAIERLAAALQRADRIVERRRSRIGGDGDRSRRAFAPAPRRTRGGNARAGCARTAARRTGRSRVREAGCLAAGRESTGRS